ncbi:MAG: tripartite tricarboxylate transporter substrate binding protein [Methylibium sp.]|nr:tripartite tricarboxylate transporter substrate binding protein [Methylibium sp.]
MKPALRHLVRRRTLLRGTAASLALPAVCTRAQDDFFTRAITLWVPWPPGGGTDLSMRVLAEAASHHLSQKVITENRSGAGGTLCMPILQQAAPDGYTIAQLPQTIFRAPYTQKVLWHPIRDVTPILQLTGTTFGMVVAADSSIKTLEDVFTAARKGSAQGKKITIASNGVGTTPHVVIEELFAKQKLEYLHIPYKGVAEQMLGVASGQVQVGVGSTAFGPFVDNGKLRLLMTFGEERSKRWPQTPTLKELGHGIVATSPYGLGGPRGLPKPIVQILHDGFRAAMLEPAYIAELARSDQQLAYLGPQEYAKACREAYAAERKIVERLGLMRQGG